MNFASIDFWIELLIGGVVIVLAKLLVRTTFPARWESVFVNIDKWLLFLLGGFLLFRAGMVTFFSFAFVLTVSLTITKLRLVQNKGVLGVGVLLMFSPLLYFKYSDFLLSGVLQTENRGYVGVLPAGVSFYSFQLVSLILDSRRKANLKMSSVELGNYAGFFPQIVAGPIERASSLLPQMKSFRFRFSIAAVEENIFWIVIGFYFKLCLADNLALLFIGDRGVGSAPFIWLQNFLFGMRIYFDFAGYSFIAKGIAGILGVRLTTNFLSPYCRFNLSEFWRAWHVTLSSWFRDYVYIPLGGGRSRFWPVAILLTFCVSGVWHGAGWNFLLWGAIHGVGLIVLRLLPKAPKVLICLGTWYVVFFGWLFFYERDSNMLWVKVFTLINPMAYGMQSFAQIVELYGRSQLIYLLGVMTLCIGTLVIEWLSLKKGAEYSLFNNSLGLGAMVVATVLLAPGKQNEFIYFAF